VLYKKGTPPAPDDELMMMMMMMRCRLFWNQFLASTSVVQTAKWQVLPYQADAA